MEKRLVVIPINTINALISAQFREIIEGRITEEGVKLKEGVYI